jgi:competence protein ComEA
MFRNLLITALAAFALNAFAAVDINKASQAELEGVKGIGPALSGKIIDARKTGAFKDWGDVVERIGGVGPNNAVKLSANGLTVGGAAYDAAASTTTAAAAAPKAGKKVAKADPAIKR